MRVTYNRKKHTNEMYDVTLACSPLEALIIMDALRKMAEAEDTHEQDRPIAERLLADMRGGELEPNNVKVTEQKEKEYLNNTFPHDGDGEWYDLTDVMNKGE